jgi:hypothetical protein
VIYRALLIEMSAALRAVQKEINPLERKGYNPVKSAVKATGRARTTRDKNDITTAKRAHDKAITYSAKHGFPRLQKQLKKHKGSLPRPLRLKKKRAP